MQIFLKDSEELLFEVPTAWCGEVFNFKGTDYTICKIDIEGKGYAKKIKFNTAIKTHQSKTEITCPYCNYIDINSWEAGDSGDIECGQCGSSLSFERIVIVSYDSVPISICDKTYI